MSRFAVFALLFTVTAAAHAAPLDKTMALPSHSTEIAAPPSLELHFTQTIHVGVDTASVRQGHYLYANGKEIVPDVEPILVASGVPVCAIESSPSFNKETAEIRYVSFMLKGIYEIQDVYYIRRDDAVMADLHFVDHNLDMSKTVVFDIAVTRSPSDSEITPADLQSCFGDSVEVWPTPLQSR